MDLPDDHTIPPIMGDNPYQQCSASQLAHLLVSRSDKAQTLLNDNKKLDDAVKVKLNEARELEIQVEQTKKGVQVHRKIENARREMENDMSRLDT